MSLQKKGDIWYVVLSFRENGKPRQKWYKSGTSEARAKKLEQELMTDHRRGDLVISERMTIKQFLDKWLTVQIKPDRHPSTIKRYESCIRNIDKNIGKIALQKLSPIKIKEHLNAEIARGMKPTTLQAQFVMLRQALTCAVDWHMISKNPCTSLEVPRRNKPKQAVYMPRQVKIILNISQDYGLHLPLCLGFLEGLRRGEICGLQWQDVNLDKKMAFIRHSLSRMNEGEAERLRKKGEIVWAGCPSKKGKTVLALGPVKTDDSEGYIPLSDVTIQAMKNEQKTQKLNKVEFGPAYQKTDFVWEKADGNPHDPDYFYNQFVAMIKEYNNGKPINEQLPLIRLHDMRHTHATLLLRKKINIKIVSKKLRHTKSSFTQDVYQHVEADMQDETATAMNELFPVVLEKY